MLVLILSIVSLVMYLFSLTMLFALRWARRTYPMDDAALVYFVLSSETGGVDSGTLMSLWRNVFFPTLATATASFLVVWLANFVCGGVLPYPMLSIKWNLLLLFYTAFIMAVKLKAWRYLAIWCRVHKKPVFSEFFDTLYIDPAKARITFPDKKRNLIIIFMESMESTFGELGLLPNLTAIARGEVPSHCERSEVIASQAAQGGRNRNDQPGEIASGASHRLESNAMMGTESVCSFGSTSENPLGGGLNLDGTSWTVAGIIAKLSGLPYFKPFNGHGADRAALRHAVTLPDILKGAGYKCIFSMGSEKRFEERDVFLEKHGFEVHDIDWYKAHDMLDKDYFVFWGFEDAKLYDVAREETAKLGAADEPFCYAMLTVDTHFPDGYRCPLCPVSGDKQIKDVVRCADNQVSSFVSWCRKQPWYSSTAIVIMGDHNYLGAPCNDFVRDAIKDKASEGSRIERRWLDLFVNAAMKPPTAAREFSAYDMFPTMLEATGASVEGGALGFGRSLFQAGQTLVESLGPALVNDALMMRTDQYEALK